MATQAKLVLAICALHNFVCSHDPDDAKQYDTEDNFNLRHVVPTDALGHNVSQAERRRASTRRDQIAVAMWRQYQEYLETH